MNSKRSRSDSILPSDDSKREYVRNMFDDIAFRYRLMNSLLTFGLDAWWRHKTLIAMDLKPNSLVLDLACGPGEFSKLLAQQGHRAVGVDFSLGMLRQGVGSSLISASAPKGSIAKDSATKGSIAKDSAAKVQGDAMSLPVATNSCDALVCGFAVRNFLDFDKVLAESTRILKPRGVAAFLEVSTPTNPAIYRLHNFHFSKVVPLIGGILSSKAAYRYLPASVVYLPETNVIIRKFYRYGFTHVERQTFSFGTTQLFLAHKREG